MSGHGCGWGIVMLMLGLPLTCQPVWAAKQPAPGPTWALQKLAERQGHPTAAAQDLKNFGHQVPPEIEAAAAGITPDAVRQAIEAGGPLTTRLETVRGRPLSADQTQKLGEAQRDYARQLAPLRQKLAADMARMTGLPENKVRKVFARDDGSPAGEKKAVAGLEKQLGSRLSAADAKRLAAARDELHAAIQGPRRTLAQQAGKITGIPTAVVQEVLP
jgi:hypothetical protein